MRKFSTMEGMMYSYKNKGAIRNQMHRIDYIFKVILDLHKVYNSLLPVEE